MALWIYKIYYSKQACSCPCGQINFWDSMEKYGKYLNCNYISMAGMFGAIDKDMATLATNVCKVVESQ